MNNILKGTRSLLNSAAQCGKLQITDHRMWLIGFFYLMYFFWSEFDRNGRDGIIQVIHLGSATNRGGDDRFGKYPSCRKCLPSLRHRLEHKYPENLAESEAAPEPVASAPMHCCPICGQPLLFQRTIQPTGSCPPCTISFPYSHSFAGCWKSVLHSGFDSPLYKKAPGKSRCCPRFWLAWVGFLEIQSIQTSRQEGDFDLAV